MRRRDFLAWGMSATLLLQQPALGMPRPAGPRRPFIWIVLRGALDALHTVVPRADPALAGWRGRFLDGIGDRLLPLDAGYALHPALRTLHGWYREKAFAPVVAVATPYRARSHFDAQDVLECGRQPVDHDDGWLARALAARRGAGIALAHSLPNSLRGGAVTRTWYPSTLAAADGDLLGRLADLYRDDPVLGARLTEGLRTRASVVRTGADPRARQFETLASACGELLVGMADADGAMLELGGWDTHYAQVRRLNQQFQMLDDGLAALRTALGALWPETLVAIATEFGRTVAINGTAGTDHGTASTLLLAGGALAGGRVLGDWPGLGRGDLFEARDLRPTSDLRAWLATALGAHWGLDAAALARVFPGVAGAGKDLVRGPAPR